MLAYRGKKIFRAGQLVNFASSAVRLGYRIKQMRNMAVTEGQEPDREALLDLRKKILICSLLNISGSTACSFSKIFLPDYDEYRFLGGYNTHMITEPTDIIRCLGKLNSNESEIEFKSFKNLKTGDPKRDAWVSVALLEFILSNANIYELVPEKSLGLQTSVADISKMFCELYLDPDGYGIYGSVEHGSAADFAIFSLGFRLFESIFFLNNFNGRGEFNKYGKKREEQEGLFGENKSEDDNDSIPSPEPFNQQNSCPSGIGPQGLDLRAAEENRIREQAARACWEEAIRLQRERAEVDRINAQYARSNVAPISNSQFKRGFCNSCLETKLVMPCPFDPSCNWGCLECKKFLNSEQVILQNGTKFIEHRVTCEHCNKTAIKKTPFTGNIDATQNDNDDDSDDDDSDDGEESDDNQNSGDDIYRRMGEKLREELNKNK